MSSRSEEDILALEALTEPITADLIQAPLDCIFADHFRQRVMCMMLKKMAASGRQEKEDISATKHFMERDFLVHILDEEEDLFPTLRRRAKPQDRIKELLLQLSEEHESDQIDAKEIISILGRFLDIDNNAKLSDSECDLFNRFADNERRHLTIENAILLPMARTRLTDQDLRLMAMRMAERRGIELKDVQDEK